MKILQFIIITVLLFPFFAYADEQQTIVGMLEGARKGDIEAMCKLGVAYYNGEKTLKDPFKAKCWIKKAYNNGSTRAEKLWEDLELWKYSGKCELSFDDELSPKYNKGDVFNDPVTGTKFVFVPKGCFLMGCHEAATQCNNDEKPLRKECLNGFWIGQFEVTQDLWYSVVGSNPSRFSSNATRPVENVSFDDIQKFINLLNVKSKKKFSLPTEAQWEYACRNGGKIINFPWGNESYRPQANCGTCDSGSFYGETAPVGNFPPNALGLYDMGGNVKEWCQDIDDKGVSRVVRGGSFTDNTSGLRCTSRSKFIPGIKSYYLGFRLVMTRNL
jgi:formylglycine-generating enzyme required for sulfatase activity